MREYFGGSGLVIRLTKEDKDRISEPGTLECSLPEWKKPKLVLHVVGEVPERGFLEEMGFHIEVIPPNVEPKFRKRYDIYLSTEIFEELTNPDDPLKGGYFASRSTYDRVDITYVDL